MVSRVSLDSMKHTSMFECIFSKVVGLCFLIFFKSSTDTIPHVRRSEIKRGPGQTFVFDRFVRKRLHWNNLTHTTTLREASDKEEQNLPTRC